jgi:hypothetical protein
MRTGRILGCLTGRRLPSDSLLAKLSASKAAQKLQAEVDWRWERADVGRGCSDHEEQGAALHLFS